MEVPAYHDKVRHQVPGSSYSLDQDEQMAIGGEERGTLRNESQVVQKAGINLPI
jgi:hypothetical protein